jgi:type IV pilus assembly protein PilN
VEDLQADRNLPVYLLNDLVRLLPDGVYISSLKQDGQVVTLAGTAQSNERVSELLRNLGNGSPWLARPDLVEIVAGNVALTPKDQRRVSNFTVKVKLLRASEAQKAASAASGALPAAGTDAAKVAVAGTAVAAASAPASGAKRNP